MTSLQTYVRFNFCLGLLLGKLLFTSILVTPLTFVQQKANKQKDYNPSYTFLLL